MSRFFSEKYKNLVPYTPGEQPKTRQYIKLNTNESPFPPSKKAVEYAAEAARNLQLYPDPECRRLTEAVAERLGVSYDEVLLTNGSDEILNFAFMAFCDKDHPAAFADITYGFYSVFAEINGVPYTKIPLAEDFTIRVEDYYNLGKTIFIANPNAPTGIALTRDQIEEILRRNPDTVVVVDEAYVDFGAQSAISLIRKYDNLLVTQTFSKSRSMAGARLGFGVGCPALIRDLNSDVRHAEELARRLRGLRCHVNLIPLNDVKERSLAAPDKKTVDAFLKRLELKHISATVRREMGADIEGACGQLRRKVLDEAKAAKD